jgi:predicted Fe-Mo cluster-binding NifX family protein
MVKVAVASKGFEKVTGHAGQARQWLLFDVPEGDGELRVSQVTLSKGQSFHHFKDDGPHPLDGISALIATSSGESFVRRMQKGGIDAVMTAETDPYKAVADYLRKQLKPPKPRPIGELFCKLRDAFSENR